MGTLDFFHWLTTRASDSGITFSTREWVHRPPGFPQKIVYAHYDFRGKKYFGIGHSQSLRTGHVIAAAEVLERVAMAHAGLANSNGCAVHTDPAIARFSARSELLERDSFLCHYYTGTRLGALPETTSSRVNEIKNFVRSLGRDFAAGVLINEENTPCVLAGINGFQLSPAEGIFLGMGMAKTFDEALEKALSECLRFIEIHLERPTDSISLDEFLSRQKKGVKDHIELAIHPVFGRLAWDRLFPPVESVSLPEKKLNFNYLEFPVSEVIKDCPLHFARASCDDLMDVQFGDRWQDSIDPERLRRFKSVPGLPLIPHPLG